MERDPHSALLEIDYWKTLLGDLQILSNLVADAGRGAVDASISSALVAVTLAMTPAGGLDTVQKGLSDTNDGAQIALKALEEASDKILEMVELSAGRYKSIRTEMGLGDPPGEA